MFENYNPPRQHRAYSKARENRPPTELHSLYLCKNCGYPRALHRRQLSGEVLCVEKYRKMASAWMKGFVVPEFPIFNINKQIKVL